MNLYEKTAENQDEGNQLGDGGRPRGWEPAKHQQYYATRALPIPPRPQSSSSSVYDAEDGPRRQPTPKGRLVTSLYHDDSMDSSYPGPFDEAAYEMIKQQEIVSPRPIQPNHPGLFNVREHDECGISPITPPITGNTLWTSDTVSPLSEAASELEQMLNTSHELWGRGSTMSQTDRRHSELGKSPRMFDPMADPLHPFVQKLNLRHSDPGSPKETRGFGEPKPGPSVGGAVSSTAELSTGTREHTQASHNGPTISSETRINQVSFAGPRVDTFSNRSQPTARSVRVAPPPLKLGQRPLAEDYVKTPFPPLIEEETAQKSMRTNDDQKKRNRLSSLGGSLRRKNRTGSPPKNEAKAGPATQETRPLDVFARASPVPKVKNMLSRAKQGLGISSDEEKKERRKEDIKRRIRVEKLDQATGSMLG
ncbi:hypothetical protein F5X96DRAFT_679885 [Biscogniauxia mediterranea]|nr:hypothetical protein F5X96DRAFT_679885 [Biscogniauxia mediterranea]